MIQYPDWTYFSMIHGIVMGEVVGVYSTEAKAIKGTKMKMMDEIDSYHSFAVYRSEHDSEKIDCVCDLNWDKSWSGEGNQTNIIVTKDGVVCG